MVKKILVSSCLVLLALSAFGVSRLEAQAQGRIIGQVLDAEGKPVGDAVVTVEAKDRAFEVAGTTTKKGKFVLSVIDGTWDFSIKIVKDGYLPIEEPIDVKPGGITNKSYTLTAGAEPGAGGLGQVAGGIEGERPVVKAYEKGAEAFAAGDFEQALVKFSEAVELDPELKEGFHALAMTHHNLKQPEQALAMVARFTEFGAENKEMEIIRFDALDDLDRLAEASEVLNNLIVLDPSPETARRAFNLGVKYYKLQELDRSIEHLSKAASTDPELMQAHRVLAQVLVSERRYDEALVHADHALALDAADADGLLVRYESLRGLGRESEGESSLEALRTSDPVKCAQTFMRVGLKEFELGQNENAIRSFKRVLSANPDHPHGNYRLGVVLVSAGETETGVSHLKKFIALAPDDPEVAVAQEMLSYLN